MAHKKEASTTATPLIRKEKIHVAIRIRPMEYYSHEGRPKILKVLNKQTLVLTELPINNDKSDLEHHFHTGTLIKHSNHQNHHRTHHHHGGQILPTTDHAFGRTTTVYQHGVGQRHVLNNNNNNNHLTNGFHHYSYGQKQQQQQQHRQQQQPLKHQHYQFDHVFDENSTQEEVYQTIAAPLIPSVFDGIFVTIFAYGATNSGKTHTMIGTIESPGIMARAIDDIFQTTDNIKDANELNVETFISYLEVYNEQIRDLLVPSSPGVHLELLDDKEQVHISGLSEMKVTTTNEVLNLLHKGNRARTVETTSANQTSSRSHAILIVTIRQRSMTDSNEVTSSEGKLYLIDLAGSERASVTKNSGARLREGAHINRSLLALGNCITALASGRVGDKYVNYRDSKLTRLLKPALGGTSRTAMIAHVNPIPSQREETRNTLIYASRTRSISNNVTKFRPRTQITSSELEALLTKDNSFAIIQDLKNEVKRLTLKLEEEKSASASRPSTFPPQNNHERSEEVEEMSGTSTLSSPNSISSSSDIKNPTIRNPYYEEFVGHNIPPQDRPNLGPIKQEIIAVFKKEAQLRSELLKVDGAMLRSALDCEIMRLMMLDWQNPKKEDTSETEASSSHSSSDDLDLDIGSKSEIHSVMLELNQICKDQEKFLNKKSRLEEELKIVRERIDEIEQSASQYLPDVQREILSLLCKLQQKQIQIMSNEIEIELKKRSKLLLRCIRQKTLGEAIIYRQRSFLNAIAGDTETDHHNHHHRKKHEEEASDEVDVDISADVLPRLLPSRKDSSVPAPASSQQPRRWSSSIRSNDDNDRIFHTPPTTNPTIHRQRRGTTTNAAAPSSPSNEYEEIHLPKLDIENKTSYPTTKYSDFIHLDRQPPQQQHSDLNHHRNDRKFSRSSSRIAHRDLGLLLT